MKKPAALQKGFAAIAAVFLVMGLAALGAFMVSFSSSQQLESAEDVMGTEAYWAARGGLEWAITSIMNPAVSNVLPANPPASPVACPSTTLNIKGAAVTYTVTVSCSSQNTYSTEAPSLPSWNLTNTNPPTIYNVTSTATFGTSGQPNYISRSVSVSLEN